MTFLWELLEEILTDAYVELMMLMIPKRISRGRRTLAKVLVSLELLILLVLAVVGLWLWTDGIRIPWGVACLSVVGVISIGQILGGVCLYARRKEKQKEDL